MAFPRIKLKGKLGLRGLQGIPGDLTPEYIALGQQVSNDAAAVATSAETVETARQQVAANKTATDTASTNAVSAATQAVATVAAGRVAAETLTALNALSPADGAVGEVLNDGPNNGTYLRTAGAWVKQSAATVPALDGKTKQIDARIGDGDLLSADLLTFLDGAGKEIGRVDESAAWHLLLSRLLLSDGSEFFTYETLDPSPLQIWDVDGRIVAEMTDSATIHQVAAEVQTARGNTASLNERISASLDANGRVKSPLLNAYRLRQTRAKLGLLEIGEAAQLIVTEIGDSYTDISNRWSYAFTTQMAARFGDAGGGFLGFAWVTSFSNATGNVRPLLYTYDKTGTWTTAVHQPGPLNLGYVTSATPGDLITVTGPASPALSAMRLFYLGTGGAIRYRWTGGAWTNLTLAGSDYTSALLTGIPAGAWTLEIEVVSGTVTLVGLDVQSAASGVRVNEIAMTGAASNHWAGATATETWRSSFAALGSDLVTILLGANDQGGGRTPAAFRASLQTILQNVRLASPAADILLVMPPENLRGLPTLIRDYEAEARDLADVMGCAYLDLQPFFGEAPADYADGSLHPWIGSDSLHPSVAGSRLMSAVISRTIINGAV